MAGEVEATEATGWLPAAVAVIVALLSVEAPIADAAAAHDRLPNRASTSAASRAKMAAAFPSSSGVGVRTTRAVPGKAGTGHSGPTRRQE